MWPEVIIAISTAILAIVAIVGASMALLELRAQAQTAHADAALSTLWHLEESWMSPTMLATRKRAGESIAAVRSNRTKVFDQSVDVVLDFLDMVGLLVRTVPLNAEIAWHRFYHPAVHYWFSVRAYVEDERKRHPQVWEDLSSLIETVMRIEAGKRGCAVEEIKPADHELEEFLQDETQGS
jgi:hypothetical protein